MTRLGGVNVTLLTADGYAHSVDNVTTLHGVILTGGNNGDPSNAQVAIHDRATGGTATKIAHIRTLVETSVQAIDTPISINNGNVWADITGSNVQVMLLWT